MSWVGNVTCMGERRNAYRSLVGRCEGKKCCSKPTHRHEDTITHLTETGWVSYEFIWFRIGPSEHSNEHVSSATCKEFLD
jgi:hypothetical protein